MHVVGVGGVVCGTHATKWEWRSEDSLGEIILSSTMCVLEIKLKLPWLASGTSTEASHQPDILFFFEIGGIIDARTR